jgi:hypothetical protein
MVDESIDGLRKCSRLVLLQNKLIIILNFLMVLIFLKLFLKKIKWQKKVIRIGTRDMNLLLANHCQKLNDLGL